MRWMFKTRTSARNTHSDFTSLNSTGQPIKTGSWKTVFRYEHEVPCSNGPRLVGLINQSAIALVATRHLHHGLRDRTISMAFIWASTRSRKPSTMFRETQTPSRFNQPSGGKGFVERLEYVSQSTNMWRQCTPAGPGYGIFVGE